MQSLHIIIFFNFLFIIRATYELNNPKHLKNLLTLITHKTFSHEHITNIKNKYMVVFNCPFNNKVKRTTFPCVKRDLLKNSKKLFNIWSNNLPKIHTNKKLEKEKVYTEADHIMIKYGINEKLNYFDLSSFNTYCSFYKLYMNDKFFNIKKNIFNNLKTIKKRCFIKTDHLNSDPLEEESYINIRGDKKEKLQSEKYKIHNVIGKINYFYVIFLNKILDHTFYFVFNNNEHYIIYKNEIIYPFKIPKNDNFLKSTNINYEINNFYLIEICHSLNGITYKQNINKLLKKLSNLYFNIEFVPYNFQLPPVFYHITFIIIFSLINAYFFYKIFLKYKNHI
ncbi:conserved Plasmodium protein, unknown function [Plasmodium gallinaceum]|uniref:Uncharacterized protein n=1 Tax=Plasmodium gallinaceum TaxID=5849 RepID=A0A1J1GRP2_PLAGA|nr:conserved Plasmodium protein, unknown function [Plasmodium gallinaceum]CRG93960.1 conserved Plasmodium protein, unknown function [Plasmodium gallinaceum]